MRFVEISGFPNFLISKFLVEISWFQETICYIRNKIKSNKKGTNNLLM